MTNKIKHFIPTILFIILSYTSASLQYTEKEKECLNYMYCISANSTVNDSIVNDITDTINLTKLEVDLHEKDDEISNMLHFDNETHQLNKDLVQSYNKGSIDQSLCGSSESCDILDDSDMLDRQGRRRYKNRRRYQNRRRYSNRRNFRTRACNVKQRFLCPIVKIGCAVCPFVALTGLPIGPICALKCLSINVACESAVILCG